jgi:hypothetical protein
MSVVVILYACVYIRKVPPAVNECIVLSKKVGVTCSLIKIKNFCSYSTDTGYVTYVRVLMYELTCCHFGIVCYCYAMYAI